MDLKRHRSRITLVRTTSVEEQGIKGHMKWLRERMGDVKMETTHIGSYIEEFYHDREQRNRVQS